jgi:hypothetical protein
MGAQLYIKTRSVSYISVERNDNIPRIAMHTGCLPKDLEHENPGLKCVGVGHMLRYPDTRSIVQEPDVACRVVKAQLQRSSVCNGKKSVRPVAIVYTGKGWVWPFDLDPTTLEQSLYTDHVLQESVFQVESVKCDVVRAPFTGIVTTEHLPRLGQVVRLSALRGKMSVIFGCIGSLCASPGSIVTKGDHIVTWGHCGSRRRLLVKVYCGKRCMKPSYLLSKCSK